jgi:hypothetical protein
MNGMSDLPGRESHRVDLMLPIVAGALYKRAAFLGRLELGSRHYHCW